MAVHASDLAIRPLTGERLPDLARLFARDRAARWCWCAYFRLRSREFSGGSVAAHRAALEDGLAAARAAGRACGLLAYREGEPVGWVSVGPRDDYPRLDHSRALAPVDEQPAWAIVCFVVAPAVRGRGVARALLDAAIAYARAHGATVVEAYPVEVGPEGRVPDGDAYRGTLGMYERAGFSVVARRRANRASPERPIVRRWLAGDPPTR